MADHQARRCPFWSHPAVAAEPLGFGQGGLYIGHADVEDDVARVVGAAADTARDAGTVGGLDAVNETVVGRPDTASATGELVSNRQPNSSPK